MFLHMKILIAPDKFKGAQSAQQVAENIAAGLRDVLPHADIETLPMADGGEGTTEVIHAARGGTWRECQAHDALGREITARYLWLGESRTAVMEMSEAAGMKRIGTNERNLESASTFGVGEMMLDAAKRGAREIIVGLGGSATNDAGFGMARALGFRFLNEEQEQENECAGKVSELVNLTCIVPSPQSSPWGRGRRLSPSSWSSC